MIHHPQLIIALLIALPCVAFVAYVGAFLHMDTSDRITGILGGTAFGAMVVWMVVVVSVVLSYVGANAR